MAKTESARNSKSKASNVRSSAKNGRKPGRTSTLLKSLPESVEHIEIVQQVACVLEELQKRVLDVKAEASKELKKIMKRYESNYKGLEKKVHQVTSDAKRQAQTSMIQLLQKWHEHKEKLPTPVAKEIEKIIGQIGAKVVSQRAGKKTSAKVRSEAQSTKNTVVAKRKGSTGNAVKGSRTTKEVATRKSKSSSTAKLASANINNEPSA